MLMINDNNWLISAEKAKVSGAASAILRNYCDFMNFVEQIREGCREQVQYKAVQQLYLKINRAKKQLVT